MLYRVATMLGGRWMRVICNRGEVARGVAEFANNHHAQVVVIGTPSDGEIALAFDADLTDSLIHEPRWTVYIEPSGSGRRPQWATRAADIRQSRPGEDSSTG
jgi:K+-sensing histidine kinase KdpD